MSLLEEHRDQHGLSRWLPVLGLSKGTWAACERRPARPRKAGSLGLSRGSRGGAPGVGVPGVPGGVAGADGGPGEPRTEAAAENLWHVGSCSSPESGTAQAEPGKEDDADWARRARPRLGEGDGAYPDPLGRSSRRSGMPRGQERRT